MSQLTDQELYNELFLLAYTEEEWNQLITLVWALPDSFWVSVCKRLIATVIVGVIRPVFNNIAPPSE
jgi:hypothetical protein